MAEYIEKETVIANLMEQIEKGRDTAECEATELVIKRFAEYISSFPAAEVQPVKRGRWIIKAKDYYKAWQDSGRSWDDMPYFVTGLKFACSNCFEQFDVNAEGVEKWNGCPCCLAKMDGDANNS